MPIDPSTQQLIAEIDQFVAQLDAVTLRRTVSCADLALLLPFARVGILAMLQDLDASYADGAYQDRISSALKTESGKMGDFLLEVFFSERLHADGLTRRNTIGFLCNCATGMIDARYTPDVVGPTPQGSDA